MSLNVVAEFVISAWAVLEELYVPLLMPHLNKRVSFMVYGFIYGITLVDWIEFHHHQCHCHYITGYVHGSWWAQIIISYQFVNLCCCLVDEIWKYCYIWSRLRNGTLAPFENEFANLILIYFGKSVHLSFYFLSFFDLKDCERQKISANYLENNLLIIKIKMF